MFSTLNLNLYEICPVSRQTRLEDLACAFFQALGLLLCIGGVSVLISLAAVFGGAGHVVSFSIYSGTLIAVYFSSALYHGVRKVHAKRVLRLVDRASIYLLIAGTYTPFALVTLAGGWGWSLMGVVWGFALAGILLRFFYPDRFGIAGVALCLGQGWMGLAAIVPLTEKLSPWGFGGMLLGGLIYSAGVAFYFWETLPFNHVVWHVFVLAASTCFYFVIMFHVLF